MCTKTVSRTNPNLLQCIIFLFLTDIHLHSGAKKQKKNNKSEEIEGGYCSSKGVILWMQVSDTIFFVDSGAFLPQGGAEDKKGTPVGSAELGAKDDTLKKDVGVGSKVELTPQKPANRSKLESCQHDMISNFNELGPYYWEEKYLALKAKENFPRCCSICAADFVLELDPTQEKGKQYVVTQKTKAWGCRHMTSGTHPCVYCLCGACKKKESEKESFGVPARRNRKSRSN